MFLPYDPTDLIELSKLARDQLWALAHRIRRIGQLDDSKYRDTLQAHAQRVSQELFSYQAELLIAGKNSGSVEARRSVRALRVVLGAHLFALRSTLAWELLDYHKSGVSSRRVVDEAVEQRARHLMECLEYEAAAMLRDEARTRDET